MQLSPKLAWIRAEKVRAGYNYNPPLEFFETADRCGMNAIFSRLEIANTSAGDADLARTLKPGQRKPDALISYGLIQPSARRAKELGLHWFYMLNLAASRSNYVDGLRDNPRRYNNGRLFSPTDDIYWSRVVEGRFLRVARMLQGDEYQIDGFLIDPEMYALGGATPPGLDFGDYALSDFFRTRGKPGFAFKSLDIEARRRWLAEHGLLDDLEAFQFARVETLARRTRERVQSLHPDAVFGFLLWRPTFWFRAVAAGFATERTPCMVCPESTYPGGFGKDFLEYAARVRREAGVPILFVPGLSLGADDPPERLAVLAGNLYHRSIHSDGYWFWALSRAFGHREKSRTIIELLTTVDGELDRYAAAGGRYASALKPTPLPAGTPKHLQDTLLAARAWTPLPRIALPAEDNTPDTTGMCLRGLHTFVFRAKKGEKFEFTIRNIQLGRYISPTAVVCYRPDSSTIAFPDIPLRGTQHIAVTADAAGAWVLAVTAHNNAFSVLATSANTVLYTPERVNGCGKKGETYRYFFYVPRETRRFHVKLAGYGGETATFRLFGPDGGLVFEEKHLGKTVTRPVDAQSFAGRVCRLEVSDIVEDHSFQLLDIPNIFAARPDQLLAPKQ
ncbi:MAG: hypothetical protein GXP31_10955 [Kiritimatiellaeota bacterium]|nr:hypothetical protein [Kiritimatiellota bacterium]